MTFTTFRRLAVGLSILNVLAFCSTRSASAQGPGSALPGSVGFTLTFDEAGTALLNGRPNPGIPVAGGGLNYLLPVPVIPGNVLVTSPIDANTANPNGNTDLLMFSNIVLASGQNTGLLTYQSLFDPLDPLLPADVQNLVFPAPIVTIPEVGPEGNNGFTWVPDPGNAAGAVYNGISDGFVTPEPSTLVLGGMGLLSLALAAYRRKVASRRTQGMT